MSRLTYEKALDRIGRALQFGINPSLEPIRAACGHLGDPQKSYRVIQVAGTNGKTSVARMVAAMLVRHGLTVGHYLSPHLEDYTERFVVDGRMITPLRFAEVFEAVSPALDAASRDAGQKLTEFEILTAMALEYFADEGCHVAVLEVGLGGRWDATTVCDPHVAVITSIALDHCDRLGPDEESVAREKAEIVKPGGRLVLGLAGREAREVIEAKALACRVPVRRLDADIEVEAIAVADGRVGLGVITPGGAYPDVVLVTEALYQRENAALAIAAAEWFLEGDGATAVLGVTERERVAPAPTTGARPSALDPRTVREALGDMHFPGRMERLSDCPTLILDGAHNPSAAGRLAEALRHAFAGRRIYLVMSVMSDKDVAGIVDELAPLACGAVCTKNVSPRAVDPATLAELFRQVEVETEIIGSVAGACSRAIELAGPEGVVVVTGSLYTAGEARTWWKETGHRACSTTAPL